MAFSLPSGKLSSGQLVLSEASPTVPHFLPASAGSHLGRPADFWGGTGCYQEHLLDRKPNPESRVDRLSLFRVGWI